MTDNQVFKNVNKKIIFTKNKQKTAKSNISIPRSEHLAAHCYFYRQS